MRPLKIGSVKISKANTDEHELMKYLICRQLCKEGKQFITECYFKNLKRADIVCNLQERINKAKSVLAKLVTLD